MTSFQFFGSLLFGGTALILMHESEINPHLSESIPIVSRLIRPDRVEWKPVANADGSDHRTAYYSAAQALGIDIKMGYTVPGSSVPAHTTWLMGMTGVYIRRSQADRESELTSRMFDESFKIAH